MTTTTLPTCRRHFDRTGINDERNAAHVGCDACIKLLQDAHAAGCHECGDTVERFEDGIAWCVPCLEARPWDCESCGATRTGDDWPAWHSPADGMVLALCDACQKLEPSAHPIGRRCCR